MSQWKWLGLGVISLVLMGCSNAPPSPEVSSQIRKSLDDSGLNSVSVSQDRTKGVVTLAGKVQSDDQRARAEAVARANAAGQVVADEIAVLPPGANDPRTVNSDLDVAIAKNMDAALVQNRLSHQVSQDVKNGVVTLKGTVNSEVARDRVAKMAQRIPNVRQVVNELQIKDQKASSSSGY